MFIDTKQTATIASAQPLPAKGGFEPLLDLDTILRILWKRRRQIFTAIVLCVVAALAFGQLAPARYTAFVQVLIDPNDLRVMDNVLRAQNQLTETHVTHVENQVRVLMSNNVAKRMVEKLRLDRDPEFTTRPSFDIMGTVRMLLGTGPRGTGDPTLDTMIALKKRISSKRVDRTYVVDAGVWAYDPHKSVQLAQALLDSFLEEQSAARGEAARRASSSLSARLAELRQRVQQAEERVEEYKRANNIVSSSGTLVNERQVTELNSQLVLARTKSAEAKARYDKIREVQRSRADPSAIGEAVGSATITALRTQLGEILRREGEINATLGKRHPAVIEIDSQARRIRRLIDEEVTRIGEAARNDMERAAANEASLAASLEKLTAGLENTNEASVRLRELERDVQASRSVYESFLVRTREVSEQERLDTTNIRVIAQPELPENRSFPPRNLFLLVGGAGLGGFVGLALAFFGEWRERRAPFQPAVAAPEPVAAPLIDPYAPPPRPAPAPYVPPARAVTPPSRVPPAHVPPAASAIPSASAPVPASHIAPVPSRSPTPAPPDRVRPLHDVSAEPAATAMTETRVRSKQAFRL